MNDITNSKNQRKEDQNELVFSYLTLRNFIGFSGILLPFVLCWQNKKVEDSISRFYFTSAGDLFVVLLCVLGVFLFTYNGYSTFEKILSKIAGLSAIGVAFFPMYLEKEFNLKPPTVAGIHHFPSNYPSYLYGKLQYHFFFATLFFLCISILALIYFPRTRPGNKVSFRSSETRKKYIRNIIYRFCGIVMLGCLVMLALGFSGIRVVKSENFIFIFETIAIEAFGLAWIVKGETLLQDGKHYLSRAIRTQ